MAGRWRGEAGQHQGARPYQEDSWALKRLGDGSLLAVVADGMGGHAGGAGGPGDGEEADPDQDGREAHDDRAHLGAEDQNRPPIEIAANRGFFHR